MNARTAVAVSPHLDDAVFSAGGTLALLVRAGWRVRVVTCFTASVPDPGPFALSTQLDKGLPADVDYMALRRAEDIAAQRVLGTAPPVHLPLPEAPHRGYGSAAELFGPLRGDDTVETELAGLLRPLTVEAALVLAPQALGGHVDHVLTARAVAAAAPPERTCLWRDVPYVRNADGTPAGGPETAVDVTAVLDVKAAAAGCYATQLGFQFGGAARTGPALADIARAEARRVAAPCRYAEALRAPRAVRLPAVVRAAPGPVASSG